MIRKRTSKDYEVRVCRYKTDEDGHWADQELSEQMPLSEFIKYTFSDYKNNLENGWKLLLEISERFYTRYRSEDDWEFEDDELWGFYDEEYGWSIDSLELPLHIKKKLDNWKKKQ